MLIKIITLAFDSVLGNFHDEIIRNFLKDKELISSQEYFFTKNEVSYLTFVLRYYPDRAMEVEIAPTVVKEKKEESWQELLSEHDMALFNLLRDWRSQRCKKEGVPPYILFTNKQLVWIVKKRPQSLSELTQIDGIGQAKAKKYGEEVLGISKIEILSEAASTEVSP